VTEREFLNEWQKRWPSLAPTAPSAPDTEGWKCRADRSGAGGNTPQDCNWPCCGCDPYADKVLAALDEQGLPSVPSRAYSPDPDTIAERVPRGMSRVAGYMTGWDDAMKACYRRRSSQDPSALELLEKLYDAVEGTIGDELIQHAPALRDAMETARYVLGK
jgi:hypothetical protein